MQFKTTKKDVMNGYWEIIEVGYCDLQHLLGFLSPSAYTCGIYGWNTDIYEMPFNSNICICTGYRPFGNVKPDWRILWKYNRQAENCHTNDELLDLLKQFVDEVSEQNFNK